MAEERRQFPRRWPHLTTLYNASPFIRGPYKEVDDWSTLRPLPPTVAGYPPSYDDTYPKGDYGSYISQRTTDKFGRSFVTAPPSNYDAFSISTYQSLPAKRRTNTRKWTGCLSFFIGLSLIISLIGAVVAIVIVLSSEERCDAYRDSVLVISSPYDHNRLVEGTSEYSNFTDEFCKEMEESFELFFIEDHICGCEVKSLLVQDMVVNVTFNILYRRLNTSDSNSDMVGAALGSIMYTILNDSLTDTFILSNVPLSNANPTPTPMASVGNLTTSTPKAVTLPTPYTTLLTTPAANLSSNGTVNGTVSEEGVLKWNTTLSGSDDLPPENATANSTSTTKQVPPPAVAPRPSSITVPPTTQAVGATPAGNSSSSSAPIPQQTLSSTKTTAMTTNQTSGSNSAPVGDEVGNNATTTALLSSSTITYPEETTVNQTTVFMERIDEVSPTTDSVIQDRNEANNSSAPAPEVQNGGQGKLPATPVPAANIVFGNVPGAPIT